MVPALTDEEVLRFVRDGFLLKRQLLDPALCARCRDRMWEVNEVPRLDRGDPNTWVGRFSEEEAHADPGKYRSGFSWRSRAIGTEDLFLDLLPRNPRVLEIAEELLGAEAEFLLEQDRETFASYIGCLNWTVTMCRLDIAQAVTALSQFLVAPRVGHARRVMRIMSYLKKYSDQGSTWTGATTSSQKGPWPWTRRPGTT